MNTKISKVGSNSSTKKVLLFLSGGISAERSIALRSAQNIYPHIDPNLFYIVPVFITPNGQWQLLSKQQAQNWPQLLENDDTNNATAADIESLRLQPIANGLAICAKDWQMPLDLIFPLLHGPYGEDGTIQGLAQLFKVPIVGSDMSGSLVNMDKVLIKAMLEHLNIPCARYISFTKRDLQAYTQPQQYLDIAKELWQQWQCPSLFVKPARMGSSIGISQVQQPQDLMAAVDTALQYDDKILIEEGFCAWELELAVIELVGGELQVSNAAQVHSNGKFYNYEQKYFPEKQKEALVVEPWNHCSPEVLAQARALAQKAFCALGLRHYGRIDLFYLEQENRLLLNEITTIPGFTAHSMFPRLLEEQGWPMQRFIPHLLQLALS